MADLATVEYSDATPAVDYSYDRLGRPTVITTDLVAQTEFTYRTDNLLPDTEVAQQDLDGNGTVDFARTFVRQYDALLRSTGYVLKSAPTTTEQSVAYGYEAVAGRYASVAAQTLSGAVNTFTYSYDAARPRLLSTVTGPAHTVTNTWEADRDILDTKTNTETAGSTIVSKFDYTVNNIGQRSGVVTTGSAFAAGSGWTWGYDSLGQVTSAAHTGNTALNQGYGYDDIGNRTQSSVGLSSPAVTSYTANMLNQYSAITGALAPAVSPSYDADGNQLAGASGQALGQTFEWDGENRLRVVKDSMGNVLVTYAYDANSRRVRRTTSTGSTLYVYDAWNCVGEHTVPTVSTTATLSRTLAWGLDLSGSLQGAGGVGGLLSVVDVSGVTVAYPTYDGNGNVSEYLDTTGAVVAHFEYDAFGKTVVVTGSAAGLDIRFSTKPQDDVTGWYYYGYRYYDAVAGRWASRDPMGEAGGLNPYGMVRNRPAGYIDYLGLDDVDNLLDKYLPDRDKSGDEARRKHMNEKNCIGFVGVACGQNSMSNNSVCFDSREEADNVAKEWETNKTCCDSERRKNAKPIVWVLSYPTNPELEPEKAVDKVPPGKRHLLPPSLAKAQFPATANGTAPSGSFDSRLVDGDRAVGVLPDGNGGVTPQDEKLQDWKDRMKQEGRYELQYCVSCNKRGDF